MKIECPEIQDLAELILEFINNCDFKQMQDALKDLKKSHHEELKQGIKSPRIVYVKITNDIILVRIEIDRTYYKIVIENMELKKISYWE